MSLVLGVLGFLIGILIFLIIPIIATSLPEDKRRLISDYYYDLSLSAYNRMILMINKHQDATIYPSKFDDELQADKITGTSETHHYEDRANNMTRVHNRPLGLVYSKYNEIISPMDVDFARAIYEIVDQGKHTTQFTTDNNEVFTAFNAHIHLGNEYRAVSVPDVEKREIESFEPNDPEKTEKDVENSQAGFKSRNTIEIMIVVISALAAMGAAWVIWSNTGSAESVVSIPVTMLGFLL